MKYQKFSNQIETQEDIINNPILYPNINFKLVKENELSHKLMQQADISLYKKEQCCGKYLIKKS